MKLDVALVWLHVTANIFWIGAICAVGLILVSKTGDARARGTFGAAVYRQLAAPAFVISFLAGSARLFLDTEFYFKTTHFMHAKLLFVLVVIGLHHAIGGRAKKMATGAVPDAGPVRVMLIALAVAAAAATFTVIFRLPP